MNRERSDTGHSAPGFALVLTLLLLTILVATGAALAALAGSEAIRAGRASRDLEHRLAVESVLELLPELIQRAKSQGVAPADEKAITTVRVRVGECEVVGDVQSERGKMRVPGIMVEELGGRLRTLAAKHDLPPESVRARPIMPGDHTISPPNFVWFDQLVRPRRFEEVFRMLPGVERRTPAVGPRTVWSDLLTLWGDGRRPVHSVHLTTAVAADLRRWYAVCDLTGGRTKVLYMGSI